MTKPTNFEVAYTRLKEIHDLLENNEVMDVEKIIALQKESKEIYEKLNNAMKIAEDSIDQDG